MKSERGMVLITLAIFGSKVDPAMLVQLRSWSLIDPSARFFYILVIKGNAGNTFLLKKRSKFP